uniref:Uncharacterized protein n=1 Tax=Grammatophora oceanica TaxID=210454 RepID=A0A7S1YI02_9STRA|mmetsp:Transcript_50265/g.75056  ORF Transcript_50265/g.75056 Transcript_50265/m.75056 type:complete len:628 (+) Transcript_50265:121-2004(+)
MATAVTETLPAGPTPSLVMARAMPQNVEELKDMSPLQLFQSQLASHTECKMDAMRRLSVVAYAIGPQETSSHLVPFLQTNVAMKQPPQEDELLLILAQQLQLLVPSLLKSTEDCLALLPILERLASMEETVVREEAVKAMNHIVPYIGTSSKSSSGAAAQAQLVSLAKRLASADWFTSKVSVAGMLPAIYKQTQEEDLRFVMRDLCGEEAPMVRRAAAANIGKFLSLLPQEPQELQPILEHLCRDEQDSVRLLAVASLKDIGNQWSPSWTVPALLPLVKAGSTDLSWRVRNNLAKSFSEVAKNLNIPYSTSSNSHSQARSTVMACFVALLQDVEGEVRASAVSHLAHMVHWGHSELFVQKLQPLLPALADDVVVDVRSKCALSIMDASEGGTLEDASIVKAFGPLLENFLQDEYPEVQLHVLQHLHRISHLLPQMSGVVSAILQMTKNPNWRVRKGVGMLLPFLAEARGMDFFGSVLLEPAWLGLLLDPVADVRMALIEPNGISKLTAVAGDAWMVSHLLPHHVKIYDHSSSNYLLRMTILKGYGGMLLEAGPALAEHVVPELLRGLSDKVPNIRMVVFQHLYRILQNPKVGSNYVTDFKPALEHALQTEEDADCRHFCELALLECK